MGRGEKGYLLLHPLSLHEACPNHVCRWWKNGCLCMDSDCTVSWGWVEGQIVKLCRGEGQIAAVGKSCMGNLCEDGACVAASMRSRVFRTQVVYVTVPGAENACTSLTVFAFPFVCAAGQPTGLGVLTADGLGSTGLHIVCIISMFFCTTWTASVRIYQHFLLRDDDSDWVQTAPLQGFGKNEPPFVHADCCNQ